jgi:predicted dehydrogenase
MHPILRCTVSHLSFRIPVFLSVEESNMTSRVFSIATSFVVAIFSLSGTLGLAAENPQPLRAGIIGLDTSHVVAFTQCLSDPKASDELKRVKIVAAYPGGSPDIPSSWNRVKEYTDKLRGMNVEIVDSIDELLKRVDVVFLESVDGRPHLEQARPVIAAGKPLFIDKPMAGSLADALEIVRLAKEKNVPFFSASSLRFSSGFQAARNGAFGDVHSCTAWSPLHLEPHHPDLFWYGVHGVETLFTVMGPGCKTVTRAAPDKVVGVWKDGRQGTFVGKESYGATVEGSTKSGEAGTYEGYQPLVAEIVKFFVTGKPPVSAEETIEILAFMEAADESKRQNGAPVEIEAVMKKAEQINEKRKEPLRAGMIGLDTSHVVAFTKLLADPNFMPGHRRVKMVAAFPGGSQDVDASRDRVKNFTEQVRGMGVEIVDSIDELLKRVDVVFLESVDGRPHLAQARPVIEAGKPLFIDKPMAGSLADALEIFRLAKEKNVPCFSSSSLRFSKEIEAARGANSPFGEVRSCTGWSPLTIEPHHPDLFWYGIHGVEALFTVMGPGCKTVTRAEPEKVVGVWKDGRQGSFIAKKECGATVEGSLKTGDVGKDDNYATLVEAIVKFFETGISPVNPDETIEILAFMEAADESKRQNGAPVEIENVIKAAESKIGQAGH